MSVFAALFDWRSFAVFRRNAAVYLRNWRTAFLPPAMEPVVYFVAFGLGLGTYVGALDYEGRDVPYATWVAPGLLAYTAFSTPFFEALYSSYVRMFYQKTWDGILATQVEVHHIVWGEVLWAGARGAMNTTVVALVLLGFDLLGFVELHLGYLFLAPPLAFISGWTFAVFALIFTALVPSIDHMNYPVFLVGVPLGFASNTYFPLESEHLWLTWLAQLNPIYWLAETYRATLVQGELGVEIAYLVGLSGLFLLLFGLAAHRLTRRRVLGE